MGKQNIIKNKNIEQTPIEDKTVDDLRSLDLAPQTKLNKNQWNPKP